MCPTLTSAATCVKPDLAVVCPITEFLKGGEIRARHVDYLVKKKKSFICDNYFISAIK